MNPASKALYEILNLNTRLFINTFDEVNEVIARKRLNDKTNNMIFIACHLLDARYYLANLIGIDEPCPYKEIFDQANSIKDIKEYPSLEEIKSSWLDISDRIVKKMSELEAAQLEAKSPQKFPIDDESLLGGIAFLVDHEGYHIGQLGLLRKYFGLPAMKYKNNKESL